MPVPARAPAPSLDPAGAGPALERAHVHATAFLASLGEPPVGTSATLEQLRARFGGPLPDAPADPASVVDELAANAEGGLIRSAGPRFFGFVIGGGVPASLAADWLTSAWDQNAGLYVIGPAAAVAEEVAGAWLVELFGLPGGVSVGFTTGATMATFTGLAAGRHALLARQGWDVERQGLFGAPDMPVVVSDESHVTIFAALQMLGLGRDRVTRIPTDGQGRMRPDALAAALADLGRPALVTAQAGNVNTGAFDPLPPIVEAVRANGGWLHVDGAFGLWAAADPARRHLVEGVGDADSWTTDAHKWLNVPYDSGLSFVRDAAAHHAAMTLGAAYYVETAGGERDPYNWVPESSRRARGFTVWAALRSLGRHGIAEMIGRTSDAARRFADGLEGAPGVRVLNEVVLNQVLVRFEDPSGDPALGDARTVAIVDAVQRDGTIWLGGTVWHGMRAMRISVSNWATTEAHADEGAAVIRRIAREIPTG
ncbi:MAG TPA: aminotransferase class V-fold PLP-dependent enzyme [Candidatus Limnocylindrales bacterium]|nr:aminotransferase class V-fold PLP-dependent enzyme [Candidatus Limnocylindrales bacterium]